MGCDIHAFVERRERDAAGKPGAWNYVSAPVLSSEPPKDDDFFEDASPRPVPLDIGRNYDVFALLADVRNNGELEPMAPPRGLPTDVSDPIRRESETWNGDGHSHSWFTLEELLAYDWDSPRERHGFLDLRTFAEWLSRGQKGSPQTWWSTLPPVAKVVSQEELRRRVAANPRLADSPPRPHGFYCEARWQAALPVEDFVVVTLHQMHRFGAPSDVRIVFFFDN